MVPNNLQVSLIEPLFSILQSEMKQSTLTAFVQSTKKPALEHHYPGGGTQEKCDNSSDNLSLGFKKKCKDRRRQIDNFDSSLVSSRSSDIRQQVEYYLSNENLKRDDWYRSKILAGKDGWFPLTNIMTAPRIQAKDVTMGVVVKALTDSNLVETKRQKKGNDKVWMIRRRNNKALPIKKAHKRLRTHYRGYTNYHDDDDFGYDACLGYSVSNVETLVEHGVMPWDDVADVVLGALGAW